MKFTGMLRRVVGAGAALAAVGAMLMAPASATAAPAPQGEVGITAIYTIKHPNSGNCLDANSDRQVFLAPCDGTPTQQWDNSVGGRYRNNNFIIPELCLASNGTQVFLMECGTDSSKWTTVPGNPKLIRHGAETTKCLHTNSGVAGRFAYLNNCTDSTRWLFV